MNALALELSGLPVTVERLRDAHRADEHGLCLGCPQPGFGVPYRPAPCTLRLLAEQAVTVRASWDVVPHAA